MREKIINIIKRCYCPNEHNIDVQCCGTCSIEQMSKCWDKVFEKYSLEVSDEPMLYNFTFNRYSYGFRKKKHNELTTVKVDKVNHMNDGIELFLKSDNVDNAKLVLKNEDLQKMYLTKITDIVHKITVRDFLQLDKTSQEFYVLEPGEELNDEKQTNDRFDLETYFIDRSIKEISYEIEIEKSCNFIIYLIPIIALK